MTRFCAGCGALLEATAWYGGQCPTCGAKIEIPHGASLPSGVDSAEVATRVSAYSDTDMHEAAGTPAGSADMTPARQQDGPLLTGDGGRRPAAQRSRRGPPLRALALAAAVVIALVGVSAYALAPRGAVSTILAPSTSSGTSATGGSALTTSGPSVPATTAASGQTVNPGATAAPSTSAVPSGTVTISPAPPVLSVSTNYVTFAQTDCVLGAQTPPLTVANNGGELLTWSASNDGGYTLSATGGTLDAGGSTQVMVSGIHKSGTVTFSAPGARGSPQTVTITCRLL